MAISLCCCCCCCCCAQAISIPPGGPPIMGPRGPANSSAHPAPPPPPPIAPIGPRGPMFPICMRCVCACALGCGGVCPREARTGKWGTSETRDRAGGGRTIQPHMPFTVHRLPSTVLPSRTLLPPPPRSYSHDSLRSRSLRPQSPLTSAFGDYLTGAFHTPTHPLLTPPSHAATLAPLRPPPSRTLTPPTCSLLYCIP